MAGIGSTARRRGGSVCGQSQSERANQTISIRLGSGLRWRRRGAKRNEDRKPDALDLWSRRRTVVLLRRTRARSAFPNMMPGYGLVVSGEEIPDVGRTMSTSISACRSGYREVEHHDEVRWPDAESRRRHSRSSIPKVADPLRLYYRCFDRGHDVNDETDRYLRTSSKNKVLQRSGRDCWISHAAGQL